MSMFGNSMPASASILTDPEAETMLEELLADLSDEQVRELAALAEVMHAEDTGR